MTEPPIASKDSTEGASPVSAGWRIGIGVVALILIVALGWQYYQAQQSPPATQPTPQTGTSEIESNSSLPADIATENDPAALFEMGNTYYKTGQLDNAVAAYKKAIEINPKFDAAYANLGAVYYAQQNLNLAEDAYLKASNLSPNDADLIYNLGAIYLQQALSTGVPDETQLNKALTQINKAIKLDPTLAQPYYGLGVANQLLGNNSEAIQAFEKFLALDDGSDPVATSNATKILQNLKSGQSK